MTEVRLYPAGTVPECTTAEWYAGRDHAPHLEQGLHRPRLEVAAQYAAELSAELDGAPVVDIGAGDGGLLSLLRARGVAGHGYDLQPSNVAAAATRGVSVELRDAISALGTYEVGDIELAPVAVCTEVIEHLIDPHLVLRQLAACADVRYLVASSPWTETNGGAYEHHLWAWDTVGYTALLEGNGWRVLRFELAGMFQIFAAANLTALEQVAP